MLINALRDSMKIENIGLLMQSVNGDADDESDDIIPEEKFYDYLCTAYEKFESALLGGKDIFPEIKDILSDYSGSVSSKEKLAEALCAMVYAYGAGTLSKKANKYYNDFVKEK